MRKQIIFATGNKDKMREIREIMEGTGYEILSMKEAGVAADPEEDGTTFEENALIKAKAVAARVAELRKAGQIGGASEVAGEDEKGTFRHSTEIGSGASSEVEEPCEIVVLADDSGLEVDYLDKVPGVYSARFMGHDTSYDVKNNAILEKLKGVPKEQRTARFVCAIAAVLPNGETKTVRRTMEGYIGYEITGENGFGYDPIFFPEGYDCSSAAITPEQKNAISHRGKALRAMKEMLVND